MTLYELDELWVQHQLGAKRAAGGRAALGGFLYELYVSLDTFFSDVISGQREALYVFDHLSDLARTSGDFVSDSGEVFLKQSEVEICCSGS